MIVEVINTGSELLLGQVVNSHLPWIAQRLLSLGLRVQRQVTVPDGSPIRTAFLEAFPRCDVLLVTGGLGPTTDDVTREITAELLGRRLIEDLAVRDAIVQRLAARGIPFRPRMARQTLVPEGATVLPNGNGTAPGLYLPASFGPALSTPHLFLLPGPPRELKPMFDEQVMPILRGIGTADPDCDCRTYHIVGMGESTVEEVVGFSLSQRGDIEVGYCARPNEVDLRLIARRTILDEVEQIVRNALGQHLVSQQGEGLEQVVVGRLREKRLTLATAESCTGGFLAHRITNVSGASEIFLAGWTPYSNESKTRELGVPAEVIAREGAVSETVGRALAEAAVARAGAHFGIGITGIAGPTGGTPEKPVGTVFIGLAERGQPAVVNREYFPVDRETFKELTTQTAFDMLRRRIF